MNTKSIFITLTILLLTASSSFAGGPPCSAKSVSGDWGFVTTGWVIPAPGQAVPVAAVARFTQDSAGNLQGGQDRSLGGHVGHETFKGTSDVKADCTAKNTVYVYDSSGNLARTSVLDIVFTDGGNAAYVIFESITLPDGTPLPSVLTIQAQRISPTD